MKFRYYIYNILEKIVLGEVKDLEEGRFIVNGLNPRTSKNYVISRKRKWKEELIRSVLEKEINLLNN